MHKGLKQEEESDEGRCWSQYLFYSLLSTLWSDVTREFVWRHYSFIHLLLLSIDSKGLNQLSYTFQKCKFLLFVTFFLSLGEEEPSLQDFSSSLARRKYSLCPPLFPLQNQPQKKSNWRQHHEDFINAIRSAKQVTKALKEGRPLPPPPPPSINPGLWSRLSYYWSCTDQCSAVNSYYSQLGFSFAPPSTTQHEH